MSECVDPITFTDSLGRVWEIVYHRFAGWRGIHGRELTVYCETAGDVIDELRGD